MGSYPNNTSNFTLPKKSISLPSIKNKIKFQKLEIGINSIKYPKSSLKGRNILKKEDYTINKFRQEAEQNLINTKNEKKQNAKDYGRTKAT